jgi:cytoskeletal protein CcmA (bactofilin family)
MGPQSSAAAVLRVARERRARAIDVEKPRFSRLAGQACNLLGCGSSFTYPIGAHMLHRDSLFRRREEQDSLFRRREPEGKGPAAAAPVTAAAALTPAPAAPAPASPSSEAARGEERKEAKLIVGPDIKMKGVEVADCDTLVVEGRIEATLDARVLQIASNGVFQGTVAVDVAEIHGTLDGELTVRKQLVLHATGRVSGKIRYAKIKVEEGAELSGEIGMLEKSGAAHGTRPLRAGNPTA